MGQSYEQEDLKKSFYYQTLRDAKTDVTLTARLGLQKHEQNLQGMESEQGWEGAGAIVAHSGGGQGNDQKPISTSRELTRKQGPSVKWWVRGKHSPTKEISQEQERWRILIDILERSQRNPQGRGGDTRIDSWLHAHGKESGLEKVRKYLENRAIKLV